MKYKKIIHYRKYCEKPTAEFKLGFQGSVLWECSSYGKSFCGEAKEGYVECDDSKNSSRNSISTEPLDSHDAWDCLSVSEETDYGMD